MSSIKRQIESEGSSNKRIKPSSLQSLAKPLVDIASLERMDDQLIRNIFYYLPLEDKIQLIALNKRFNNCLAESQLDLAIDHKIGNQFNSWLQLEVSDTQLEESIETEDEEEDEELDYFLKVNKSGLNFLLKTFKKIETIDLCNTSLDVQTVAVICDNNCPKLKELKFTDFGVNNKSIENLGQTYGQRLTKLVIQSSFCGNKLGFDKLFLGFCQNLIEIHCESIETFVQQNEDFLPKLQNITTFIRKTQDFDSLKQIANRYKNQLKSLTLFMQLEEGIEDCKDLDCIADIISLQSLNLDFFDWFDVFEKIDKSIEKMAISCKRIEIFRIGFNFCSYNLISLDLFKSLGLFSNVKRFSAQLLISDTKRENLEQNDNQSAEDLKEANIGFWKGCQHLTHLDICFSEMTDKFIENIDLFLPNLISIELSSAKDLTDCALNSFIKLKNLKSLKLSKNRFKRETFPHITDSGIEKLMTSNPNLRSLQFLGVPNITQKTIDLFLNLAQKHPNRGYYFQCIHRGFDDGLQYINNIDISSLKLPNNLSLNIQLLDVSDDELFVSDESESDELSEFDSEDEMDSSSETKQL